ncbi:hypothetical protein [Gelidibacter mesophilus]|uniref:hypothetical protein n=1 Tax=Gelidibacter mesophilus TaxID=169050 RepID=UPI0004268137|nr:hypothetical protein [Gelidibacter mesophilus]
MASTTKVFVLKYAVPCLAVIVIAIQVFFMNTRNLSKWKGGGYGMYTELHYASNQIYIPGLSVDSLLKNNREMKDVLGYLILMPNRHNLNKAGALILKTTHKDSLHIQVWKPSINSRNRLYTRVLIDEIHLKKTDF